MTLLYSIAQLEKGESELEMEIQKNDRIKSLINHLEQKFGVDKFLIKDFWDSDLEAIGFANASETKLVYVSAHEEHNDFYVALESGDINTSEYTPDNEYNNIDLTNLELIFAKHLNLAV